MNHNLVALLPLKANSERVPGKNFRDLAGKPLFQWMLDTLLSLEEIDLVVINTDARNLLVEHGLVESERVVVRDRAETLCGDHVSMNKIIADDIANVPSETYLMTHTTNPLLGAGTIRRAIAEYSASDCDSLFSVNRYQTRFYTASAEPINHDPSELKRTQDLDPYFEENSCLYIFSKQSFDKVQARIGSRPMMLETPKIESIDIDEPSDWTIAEALARVGVK